MRAASLIPMITSRHMVFKCFVTTSEDKGGGRVFIQKIAPFSLGSWTTC